MLILSRRVGESIIIGDREIDFKILGIKGNQIRIGVQAPKGTKVNREEIYQRIENGLERKVKPSPLPLPIKKDYRIEETPISAKVTKVSFRRSKQKEIAMANNYKEHHVNGEKLNYS